MATKDTLEEMIHDSVSVIWRDSTMGLGMGEEEGLDEVLGKGCIVTGSSDMVHAEVCLFACVAEVTHLIV